MPTHSICAPCVYAIYMCVFAHAPARVHACVCARDVLGCVRACVHMCGVLFKVHVGATQKFSLSSEMLYYHQLISAT